MIEELKKENNIMAETIQQLFREKENWMGGLNKGKDEKSRATESHPFDNIKLTALHS